MKQHVGHVASANTVPSDFEMQQINVCSVGCVSDEPTDDSHWSWNSYEAADSILRAKLSGGGQGAEGIVRAEEFEEGIRGLRKHPRISSDQVCTASLICIYYTWPHSFLACMNSFLSSIDQIGRERVVGWVKGKESNKPVCAKVRCVLPLNALLSICDIVLATTLNHHIDMLLPPDFSVYVGARPKTQCADIAFACHLVVEKSLDDQGRGALAQSDISQYYDNLPVIKVLEWCGHKGVNRSFLLVIGRLFSIVLLCMCSCWSF